MGVISRVFNFSSGELARAEEVNAELDNILSTVNGELDSSNIKNSSLDLASIATSDSVTSSLIKNDNVLFSHLSSSTVTKLNEESRNDNSEAINLETRTDDPAPDSTQAGRVWVRTDL